MGFQHLFLRRSTAKAKEKDDVTETSKVLIDARFDRLESNFQLLRNEWADSHEKLMLLYDRTRKRLEAIKKASGDNPTIEAVPALPQTREDILRSYLAQNGG